MSDSFTKPPANLLPGSIVDTYLRDSGGDSQDRSIQRQLDAVKAYCIKHGFTLRHIYKDVAKSGTTTAGRDDFHKMIAATRNVADRPAAILIWNYARFARNLDDAIFYKALLRSKRKIIIHSLTDNVPEGPYARLVEIMIDMADEEKSRQTSADTKDGLQAIVRQGAVPGVPPRGMKREPIVTINPRTGKKRKNHRWIPDPKLKRRVYTAFEMRSRRASLNQIDQATKLFNTTNSYTDFFKRKIYYGTLQFGEMEIENYCEAIVPKKIWDKVQIVQAEFARSQNLKEGDSNHPRRLGSDFLVSGLARCGHCGSPLYGRTSHQKTGYKYQSYLCTLAYRKRGACTKGRIPRPAFESAVINALIDSILNETNILKEMLRIEQEQISGFTDEQKEKRKDLLNRLATNKRELNHIAQAIRKSGSSSTLLKNLNELETEKIELTLTLNDLENSKIQPLPKLSEDELKKGLDRIKEQLRSKDPQVLKSTLRNLIAYVDVIREEKQLNITLYYFIPPNSPAPEENMPPEDDQPMGDHPHAAPTIRHSSGPPVHRHIIAYSFKASTKRPRE